MEALTPSHTPDQPLELASHTSRKLHDRVAVQNNAGDVRCGEEYSRQVNAMRRHAGTNASMRSCNACVCL